MMVAALLLALQPAVNLPAVSPPSPAPAPVAAERLSLVVANTVSETDPQPLCPQPNCTALFLGRYAKAAVVAGRPLPADFSARIEMGSPWNRPTRLALIVAQDEAGALRVRAVAGFSSRTGEACFEPGDVRAIGWIPQVAAVRFEFGALCLRDPAAAPPR